MKSYPHAPRGLKPTLRHQLILVLFFATVIASDLALYRAGILGNRLDTAFSNAVIYFLLWTPLWLCVLLLALDRRGPVRQWYVACVMVAWSLLIAFALPLADLANYAWSVRTTPVSLTSGFLAVLILVVMPHQIRLMLPVSCPRCRRMSVIPVLTLKQIGFPVSFADHQEGWCAVCGAKFRRARGAAWVSSVEPPDVPAS